MKYYFPVLFVFFVFSGFGQNTVLLQNINPRAKELKHGLNQFGDSLELSCSGTILKVEIFNDAFEQIIPVNKKAVKIPLKSLPNGRFLVEARLIDKLIVMTLIRTNTTETSPIVALENSESPPEVLTPQKVSLLSSEDLESVDEVPVSTSSLDFKPKVIKSYWVEYLISNGNSSHKTSRFATKEMVDKMISKNKIEIKTTQGKLNNLKIWEVYNTAHFLRLKRVNPDLSKVEAPDYFNAIPYYSSDTYMASL